MLYKILYYGDNVMDNIFLKKVDENDFSIMKHLALKCPPLDVHTSYTYWVVSKLFGEYCFLAKDGEKPIGYIMCVKNDSVLLIWQIGILKEYRKKGISKLLIEAVFDNIKDKNIDIYVTISDTNKDSYYSFYNFCLANNYSFSKIDYISIDDIDDDMFTEQEYVYKINKIKS